MNWLIQNAQQERHPFDQLFEDMLDGFGLATVPTARRQMTAFSPRMDIKETDTAYELSAELPGLTEKDVELVLENNVLTLSGEKSSVHKEDEGSVHRMERSYGRFQRRFTLPAEVDEDKVDATFKNGVLTVNIPKLEPEKTKARKIELKS